MITSKHHFLIKKRIFERMYNIGIENKDQGYIKDAWKLSDEMLDFLKKYKNDFERNIAMDYLTEKRYNLLNSMTPETRFELDLW